MTAAPVVGEVWERTEDGRAPVRVGRVWYGNIGGTEADWVRVHPVRGGRYWLTTVAEFVKRYQFRSEP